MPKTALRSLLPTREPLALLIAFVMMLTLAAAMLASMPAGASAATGTSTISGTAFEDLNNNGVFDSGDTLLSNRGIYLMDSTGQSFIASTATDANGHYSFTGLADGSYMVKFAPPDWSSLQNNWVPDTTGSIFPTISVTLSGSATANFGWRAINRSTDISAPISTYVGPNGLRVNSYDDVVPATTIYNDLMSGALVGPEASKTTVYFDYSTNSDYTTYTVSGSQGSYSNYQAGIYMAYLAWLNGGDQLLFHEYGHAWSMYYALIAQQDPNLTGYLQARGLTGNPNLYSSHMWDPREMIAEDYRQLFGTLNAQSEAQMNPNIPPASQVPGLKAYLEGAFMQSPQPADSTAPSITGTPVVGQMLTCNPGTWSGSPSYTYQWLRNAAAISGATAQTYTAVSADAGSNLSCSVTAINSAGSATASSPAVQVSMPPAPSISSVAMSPSPVKTSGAASFGLSSAASVTETIVTSNGSLVATLLNNVSEPGGTVSVTWNRPKSVKSGTYKLNVKAVDTYGRQTTSSATFSAS